MKIKEYKLTKEDKKFMQLLESMGFNIEERTDEALPSYCLVVSTNTEVTIQLCKCDEGFEWFHLDEVVKPKGYAVCELLVQVGVSLQKETLRGSIETIRESLGL